ncbi:MAG: A/G-specific adenine glycosylase, partial [Flavobacterium sp.]
ASVDRIEEVNPISIVHKLSHQHLNVKFWKVTLDGALVDGVSSEHLKTFPFPIVIHNFIEHITY